MKTEITCKNFRMSDKFHRLMESKLSKLDKYFDEEPTVKAVLTGTNNKYKMELSSTYAGNRLRAEVVGHSMNGILDECLAKIERQLERCRGKANAKRVATDAVETLLEEDVPTIARVKRFAIDAMSVEEAAVNLDMVDHDFFLFVNEQTDAVCCVYRRKDGTVGLLEPEIPR